MCVWQGGRGGGGGAAGNTLVLRLHRRIIEGSDDEPFGRSSLAARAAHLIGRFDLEMWLHGCGQTDDWI